MVTFSDTCEIEKFTIKFHLLNFYGAYREIVQHLT